MQKSPDQQAGQPEPAVSFSSRITSIDALRGFTMFFIIGGGGLFISLSRAWPNSFTETLAMHMRHADWEGFYFLDLIFPLFLVLVGLLVPFSISRSLEKGMGQQEIMLRVLKRALVLIFLGLANYGLFNFDWPGMRWSSVLGRIGICYFAASLLVLKTGWRTQAGIIVVILLGYWAAMKFIPVPGYGAGVLTPEGALSTWLDQKLIPGTLGLGIYDRQGVLSTFTAIATTLTGVLAGHWLRTGRPDNQKLIGFVTAGVILLVSGRLWGEFFFISRNVWTSSFVLYTSGWSFLLLALFYWLIDVKGYKKWSFFLVVIGMNAITIWVGQNFIDFRSTTDAVFMGVSRHFGDFGQVFLAMCLIFVKWLFLLFLYRQKIFLRA